MIGVSASVEATVGQLVITQLEYPVGTRRRHSTAFERHIANRNRTKAASDVVHEHRGRLVREHILAPTGASTLDLAHAIGVSQDLAECFLAGDHDVDTDLARRLGRSAALRKGYG